MTLKGFCRRPSSIVPHRKTFKECSRLVPRLKSARAKRHECAQRLARARKVGGKSITVKIEMWSRAVRALDKKIAELKAKISTATLQLYAARDASQVLLPEAGLATGVLIQEPTSRRYLNRSGVWDTDLSRALAFSDSFAALDYCAINGLAQAHIVLNVGGVSAILPV